MTISLSEFMATIAAAAAVALLLLPLSATGAPSGLPAIGLPGCNTTCGNISVPYPFGMGPARCYHSPGFKLTCDDTTTPPRLLLGGGSMLQVEHFSVQESLVHVTRTPGDVKVDAHGSGSFFGGGLGDDDGAYIMLADYVSELVLLGCNVRATIRDGRSNTTVSSCSSLCGDNEGDGPMQNVLSSLDSSMLCTGVGCCQAPIVLADDTARAAGSSDGVQVQLDWFGRNRRVDENRMPTRVFVAERRWFENKQVSDRLFKQSTTKDISTGVPVLLSWEFAHDPSRSSNITSSSTMVCHKRTQRGGYTCYCKDGYGGNPYIPDGCQDINECELPEDYPCLGDAVCTNKNGSFDCACPSGTHGNPSIPGGCFPSVSTTGKQPCDQLSPMNYSSLVSCSNCWQKPCLNQT